MTKHLKKMNLKYINKVIFALCLAYTLPLSGLKAQPGQIIDQVAAVIGNKILMLSEVESQYQQVISQGMDGNETLRCRVVDQMLMNKLLLHQAIIDSVEVGDAQVENELDRRIDYMVSQIGSEVRLEEYYEKSIPEIRDEFKPLIKEQLQIQMMQSKVTSNVSVSPAEVREFFRSIHPDSLPFINSEIEFLNIFLRWLKAVFIKLL